MTISIFMQVKMCKKYKKNGRQLPGLGISRHTSVLPLGPFSHFSNGVPGQGIKPLDWHSEMGSVIAIILLFQSLNLLMELLQQDRP